MFTGSRHIETNARSMATDHTSYHACVALRRPVATRGSKIQLINLRDLLRPPHESSDQSNTACKYTVNYTTYRIAKHLHFMVRHHIREPDQSASQCSSLEVLALKQTH